MAVDPFGLLLPQTRLNLEREQMAERVKSFGPLLDALKNHDSEIVDLKFFGPRAEERDGIKPGRWHVHRRNTPPAPDSFIPIETPDGAYREPDFGVLEDLRRRDLRNSHVWEEKKRQSREMEEAYLHPKSTVTEGELEEMAADLRAAWRVAGEGGLKARKWGKG